MQTHLVSTKRPSDLVDDVLVQRAHVGDQGAFEILVDRAFLSVSAHLPPFPMSALHEDSTVCEEMKLPSLFLEKESQYARSTDHEYRLGYLDNGDNGGNLRGASGSHSRRTTYPWHRGRGTADDTRRPWRRPGGTSGSRAGRRGHRRRWRWHYP